MSNPGYLYPNDTPRPLQVNWDVLSEAFEIVKNNWVAFCVYSLIAFVASYIVNFVVQLPFQAAMMGVQTTAQDNPEAALGAALAAMGPMWAISWVVSIAVNGMLAAGIYMLTIKVLTGIKPEIGDAFEMFKLFMPIVVAQLLATLFALPGICVICIGYVFTYGLFSMAVPVVLVEKKSGYDAVIRSLELAKPHWMMVGLFVLVTQILAGIGFVACCVGIFFTLPWAMVAQFLMYRDLSGATFSGLAAAGPTPYPRQGEGSMPAYSGPTGEAPGAPETPPTEPSDQPDEPSN